MRSADALVASAVTAMLFTLSPASAVEASGMATIRCGAFSGDPGNARAWVSTVPYSIAGTELSFSTTVRGEENQWSGTLDRSGHIMLTGSGSGGGGAWAMRFTGSWRGAGATTLSGGYHNTRGMVGHRVCRIAL